MGWMMSPSPRDILYDDVVVKLSGTDGSAFAIIGNVRYAIRQKHGAKAALEFVDRAKEQGSYDNLLAFCMTQVVVE